MSERYLVEYCGTAFGILVRDGETFVFHASDGAAQDLQGQRFDDPQEALERVKERARQKPDGLYSK